MRVETNEWNIRGLIKPSHKVKAPKHYLAKTLSINNRILRVACLSSSAHTIRNALEIL
jgi:hypothetical protein